MENFISEYIQNMLIKELYTFENNVMKLHSILLSSYRLRLQKVCMFLRGQLSFCDLNSCKTLQENCTTHHQYQSVYTFDHNHLISSDMFYVPSGNL